MRDKKWVQATKESSLFFSLLFSQWQLLLSGKVQVIICHAWLILTNHLLQMSGSDFFDIQEEMAVK